MTILIIGNFFNTTSLTITDVTIIIIICTTISTIISTNI